MPDLELNAGLQERALAPSAAEPVVSEGRAISGIAVNFNEWADIAGIYLERFAPGSWDESIADGGIKMVFDHGRDMAAGSKPIGKPDVQADEQRASYGGELYDVDYVNALLPALRDGQMGSSFRFQVPPGGQSVVYEPERSDYNPECLPEVTITRAIIKEVGPTTFPAYAGSTASVRSALGTPEPTPAVVDPATTKERYTIMNREDLLAEVETLRSEVTATLTEHADKELPDEIRSALDVKRDALKTKTAVLADMDARSAELAALAAAIPAGGGAAGGISIEGERSVAHFNTPAPGATRGSDVWDLSTVSRSMFGDIGNELRERSLRVLEAKVSGLDADNQERVRSLIEDSDSQGPIVAEHILKTGSPLYRSAFRKTLAGAALSGDEIRAMSLTGAAGGFATIPYQLDPTIIRTGSLAINPLREISRVVQIAGTNVWKGVSSGAVVASYDAEASVVSDDSPTYAQPSITCYPARAFVPYSFEIGEDYPGLLADLGVLMADAKQTLNANKQTLGTGSGEPYGIVTRATTTVATAGAAAFARGDLDLLDNALPPRYQGNASIIGNRAILNRVPAFDTANGNTLFGPNTQLGQPRGATTRMRFDILGLPTYQVTDMVSTLTTGSKILIEGDFSQYVIVDRIGAQVEQIQNLFDPTTGRPTGQRGLMMHWRDGADVTNALAFRTLVTA